MLHVIDDEKGKELMNELDRRPNNHLSLVIRYYAI